MREELLAQMRQAIQDGSYRFSEHALMEAAEDRLPIGDIEGAIVSTDAEVIEDYPQDLRGPSLLVLGWLPDSAPIHAVLSYSARCRCHHGLPARREVDRLSEEEIAPCDVPSVRAN